MAGEITQLLAEVNSGNSAAVSRLTTLGRERHDQTLHGIVFVHEAYPQLVIEEDRSWRDWKVGKGTVVPRTLHV